MSKAEDLAEKALKVYPKIGCYDNIMKREGFIVGYRQAEKDLALTYKDVARLFVTASTLTVENTTPMTDKAFYQEVLKRFLETKRNQ